MTAPTETTPDAVSGKDLRGIARTGHVHFMGVGGAGMCALAELFAHGEAEVSGCDLHPGASTDSLREINVPIYTGHDPSHMEHAAALVISAAVPGDHPEILEAVRLGIPVFKRAKALGQWVNQGRVLAVAGTHGKTTTTAMAAEILTVAGLDPTGLVGGRVPSWKGNLRRGGELYVVEADEYDRSFLELQPTVAIVTSVEADHLDTYGGLEGVAAAFHEFLEALPEDGRGIICGDDHGASRLLPALDRRGYTYGTGAGCQLRAVDVKATSAGMEFTVMEEGIDRGAYRLPVPGLHNLRNALGATAAARFFGVDWDAIRKGLASFQGVARRFDTVGEVKQILVVDDYAHHPSEITATLAAARAAHPDRRIVAVFQPHLFTRTRDFAEDFGRALTAADVVWVTDIFPAREDPIAGVTGELVAFAADWSGATVHYHVEIDTLPEAVVEELAAGDLLVTMGAGSVDDVARRVITLLEGRNLA